LEIKFFDGKATEKYAPCDLFMFSASENFAIVYTKCNNTAKCEDSVRAVTSLASYHCNIVGQISNLTPWKNISSFYSSNNSLIRGSVPLATWRGNEVEKRMEIMNECMSVGGFGLSCR
jgi:hypothetical protein